MAARTGVGLEIGVGVRDRFTVTGELEALRGDPGFRTGVRATSVIGAVSGLALPLVVPILIRDD